MKLKVLFYNIQFMFPFIINEASHDRAQKIANFINSMGDIDIIVFCEAFDKNARERLILYLYKNNFKYSTPILTTNNYFFNGGVFIISKYPILNYKFYIYKNSIGTDYFTNKGVVYACIKIKNKLVNIFGTHLQAWCSYNFIRNKQIIELKEFIKKFKFQSDDVVIICGDFNTSLKNIPKIFVSPVLISKQKYLKMDNLKPEIKTIVEQITESFIQNADPEKATQMSKYMKNKFDCLGIVAPKRVQLFKGILENHKLNFEDKLQLSKELLNKNEK